MVKLAVATLSSTLAFAKIGVLVDEACQKMYFARLFYREKSNTNYESQQNLLFPCAHFHKHKHFTALGLKKWSYKRNFESSSIVTFVFFVVISVVCSFEQLLHTLHILRRYVHLKNDLAKSFNNCFTLTPSEERMECPIWGCLYRLRFRAP